MKKIAIFASGSGTNAEKIAQYFAENESIAVSLILSNNSKAGVIERAKKLQIPVLLFDKKTFNETEKIAEILKNQKIDLIVLAGFMCLVPSYLVEAFPNKIINIHPALLPKFGGKGMYGHFVHEAVINAKEKESGITIHYVNEHYDEGAIIFQASCRLSENDTPETLAQKIHVLEHKHFAETIEKILNLH